MSLSFMQSPNMQLAGVRGTRGWLAGICLVPKFRDRRLGPVLFTEYLTLLKEQSSIELLQFECITQNARALKMYTNFGCEIDGALHYYNVDVPSPDLNAGDLQVASDTSKIDLRLPWLQHTTAYSWQREVSVMLNGVHRQFIFKRESNDDVELAFAVEVKRDPPRVNGIAYRHRPTQEAFVDCLRRVAAILGVGELTFPNEPESSDLTPLLDAVGKRDETSQKHLTLAIERK